MTKIFDLEETAEVIAGVTDAELYRMRVVNRALAALIAPDSYIGKLQVVIDAEAKRRIKADPEGWITLRRVIEKEGIIQ